ncbi:MAG: D-3-phosphoglycerate dehydrogenase / 2-oxoglutarate reductase [Thermomicrobiales bacterium]|jgi:D-3-phosphoglycerate dehydrogenase|nr:D-3-phosphoglycerate dehydrogenase / 2-oxoglutarate reductase [Thermomicrobiales bacterium]MEA2594187.1 D-3-phosphoglycerate dehydrogenase / 2-oxoglutarate reductase [Thermomicrobiales bacterium]
MRPRVVIAYAKPGEAPVEEEILRAAGIEVVLTGELESESARTAAREAEALMVGLNRISADLMDELTRLKIVTRVGTGVDAIDIPAATTRGIWVTNVPDYSIDEVSTHAISLVLAQARMLFPHRVAGRDGRWRYRAETPIRRFAGQTLGVLGMGRIGSASARKGRGLGLEVIAHDPYLPDERFEELGVRRVDFDTLMRESDFLTLHVPLTDETRRIVDARALSLMKPTAYLVNTARGEVIDVDALVEAVRAGTIAGAGIDVLPEEPPAADHPILHDDRIIVTPHIGWASVEAGHDSKVRGSEDVVRVLRGERPKYPINEIERVPAGVAG